MLANNTLNKEKGLSTIDSRLFCETKIDVLVKNVDVIIHSATTLTFVCRIFPVLIKLGAKIFPRILTPFKKTFFHRVKKKNRNVPGTQRPFPKKPKKNPYKKGVNEKEGVTKSNVCVTNTTTTPRVGSVVVVGASSLATTSQPYTEEQSDVAAGSGAYRPTRAVRLTACTATAIHPVFHPYELGERRNQRTAEIAGPESPSMLHCITTPEL